eukprot:220729_1
MAELTAKAVLKEGNTAVITGASSGIGRATAVYCSSIGMNVWMVDIDEKVLAQAKELVISKQAKKEQTIEVRTVDVSSAEQLEKLSTEVFANGGKCHFLMNNAGICAGGGPLTDIKTWQRTISVNTYGPIHGCLAFIPKMQRSGEVGIIVNTGSKQGITMPPGNLVYNVSKSALKAYTEGLEFDLAKQRRESGGKLKAALLVPGWVNTSLVLKHERAKAKEAGDEEKFDPNSVFFSEEKPAKGAWMPPQVVEYMVDYLNQDKFYIICPDNDVDRELDNFRMTWTMQDITKDRPPLSRWHPEYKDKFKEFVDENKKDKPEKQ